MPKFVALIKRVMNGDVDAAGLVIRSREVLEATWDEFDLDKKVWTILDTRMKTGKEHRLPLTTPALVILKQLKRENEGVGTPQKKQLCILRDALFSNVVMLALLKRMNRRDITVHGFRSSFRNWAADETNFPRELAEAALAHASQSRVEAVYRRSNLFEKRRLLMEKWVRYCKRYKVKAKYWK